MASSRWWLVALEGVVGIIFGIIALVAPGATALALLSIIAAWSILTGIFEIAMAVQLRKEIDNEWMLILSGILSVVFGGLLIVQPGAGALSVVWLIGFYAVLFGILTLMLAFRLRGLRNNLGRALGAA